MGRPRKDGTPAAAPSRAQRPLNAKRRTRIGDMESDPLYVDPDDVPAGFSIEYKRTSTYGQAERPAYLMGLQKQHWEPVKISIFPQFAKYMPANWSGDTVERGGVTLYIREDYLTEEARDEEHQKAVGQVREKTQQLGGTVAGEFERTHNGSSLTKVRQTYERAPVDES